MLIYFLFYKSWFIWSTTNTVRFFSKYFICHFHFFRSKIFCMIFTHKTICCSRLFSNFDVFFMFYNVGSIFLTTRLKHFDFIEWFDLNSSSNSLFEILSIKDFFGWFYNVSVYFVYFFKNVEIFFIRINSIKY